MSHTPKSDKAIDTALAGDGAQLRELVREFETSLRDIAFMPEHDQDDAHRLRHKAKQALR